jgi:hypothetical protein
VYLSDHSDVETWEEASPIGLVGALPPIYQTGTLEYLYIAMPSTARAVSMGHYGAGRTNMPHIFAALFAGIHSCPGKLGIDKISKFAAHHFHTDNPNFKQEPAVVVEPLPTVRSSYQLGRKSTVLSNHHVDSSYFGRPCATR